MSYSNSLFLFFGLFIILSSQVLAHDMSEALTPGSGIMRSKTCSTSIRCGLNIGGVSGVVAAAANDFNLSDVALDSLTEFLRDATQCEQTRRNNRPIINRPQCHASLQCGGQIGFAYNIFFPEIESQAASFIENTLMKNDAEAVQQNP